MKKCLLMFMLLLLSLLLVVLTDGESGLILDEDLVASQEIKKENMQQGRTGLKSN